jgi:hypothetical protein
MPNALTSFLCRAYGKKLQPKKGGFKELYDALQLQHCGVPAPMDGKGAWASLSDPLPPGQPVLFVRPTRVLKTKGGTAKGGAGSGSGSGSGDFYESVADAIAAARTMPKPVTIALKEGGRVGFSVCVVFVGVCVCCMLLLERMSYAYNETLVLQ